MKNIDKKVISQMVNYEWFTKHKAENEILNQAISLLKLNNKPVRSDRMKITRGCPQKNLGVTYDFDDATLLDTYYVAMINDTLSEIRKGHEAYLYNLEQVRSVLKYEPEAIIKVKDGIYYVTLDKAQRNKVRSRTKDIGMNGMVVNVEVN